MSRMKETVLLVEDNVMNQEGFSRLLMRKGFKVIVAETGLGAIKLYKEGPPGIILLDINLPDISGYEVARTIRSFEREQSLAEVPIIAISAHTLLQDKEQAAEAGCNDFEPKPMEFRRLFQKISKYMRTR